MTQVYSVPSREKDPYSLPDVEVFYLELGHMWQFEDGLCLSPGWYWWSCLPGCLPDGDPIGPFATEEEANEQI